MEAVNTRTTDNIRLLIDIRRGAKWGPGRVAAGSALVEAMLDAGPAALTLAEQRLQKLERDRLYSRARRARKEIGKLAKAREAVLKAMAPSVVAYSQACSGRVALEFNSAAEARAFHCAWADYVTSRRAAALSDLAQLDAELLDAAE